MYTIYKFIDEEQKADIQKNKRISLSRPLLRFGEPEGLLLDFFRDINKLIDKTQNIIEISPTSEILEKIKEWYSIYYSSLPDNVKQSYNWCDILSDLRILMCTYFQTYCGYFTSDNLDCPKTRKKYITSNSVLIKKYNKTSYLKLDIQVNELNNIHWEYYPTKKQEDFIFTPCSLDQQYHSSIAAALHLHDVIYLQNDFSASDIFKRFNNDEDRNSSCWFKFTKSGYASQREKRLIFYLCGNKPGLSRRACDNIFSGITCNTLEETLFYYAVSTAKYAKEEFPEYVYLKIKDFEIIDI